MPERFIGVDVGAETLKLVELTRVAAELHCTRRVVAEHHKSPGPLLLELLADLDWPHVAGAAVCGRLSRLIDLPRIPTQQALAHGRRWRHGDAPVTLISIGSRGFSVLELRDGGREVYRENSRCSQGTGNFLGQLVERFALTIEQASDLCADVGAPAPLSGRCPVILKTDMTHLANRGVDRAQILAGLFDAVAENVEALVKPRSGPRTLALIGGVSRAPRVREHFRRFAERRGLALASAHDDDLLLEAFGCAALAAEAPAPPPPLARLLRPPATNALERLGPLADQLALVDRRPLQPAADPPTNGGGLVLGLDIGSTGSKLVALDAETHALVWEDYRSTNGDPLGAAQGLLRRLLAGPAGRAPARAFGVTGSGREIAGSLLATCYGGGAVFVLNEIAAHAAGALHFDQRVDTIFEIGGQDAKYIRLADGRVVDAAMNEACSAGTGSFIEEQGRRFPGGAGVAQLGDLALAAPGGVSLGQHCSVFMAEVIDEAVAAGVARPAIIAGLYDAVVQNYLNRVKGPRSIGQVVFCQGMPFSAPALAAAVARRTGARVVVPPSPGTVGALGIALLAARELPLADLPTLDLRRALAAQLESRDAFVCPSTRGCGGAGAKCRIERLSTVVDGQRQLFTWGGACSLHDSGVRRRKLPDRAPDPFRECEELAASFGAAPAASGGGRVALSGEFALKGLLPFFATFLRGLGLDPLVAGAADQTALKRGIEQANTPFCAPMQLQHGLLAALVDCEPDFVFAPLVRSLPPATPGQAAACCPIVQGAPDIARWDLGRLARGKFISPVFDCGPLGLASPEFRRACAAAARLFGAGRRWRAAYAAALAAQERFDGARLELGRTALEFCAERGVTPIVVIGRPYTIYNTVLNSNVPALLREQGALPIPLDCLPTPTDAPVVRDMYWAHGQTMLRAAHHIRRTPGLYGVFCSNYSCGPDSFAAHFVGDIMAGKPFAIIETDGHSGDAGTKTRIEAFLHCVGEDLARGQAARPPARSFQRLASRSAGLGEIRARGELTLLPRMGGGSDAVAACLAGLGVAVEALPAPDREALELGRRHTSGKECAPLWLTLGSVLQRVTRERDVGRRFAVLLPRTTGPCRFGVYHLLQKLIFERLDLADRLRIWSPSDRNYFAEAGEGFAALCFAGIVAIDLLDEGLRDVRPRETRPGLAQQIRDRYAAELCARLRQEAGAELSGRRALAEAASGRAFGCAELLSRAAPEFAAARRAGEAPTALLVGEIYVRCNPFANDFVIDKLEQRGVRVRAAPTSEWLEYVSSLNRRRPGAGLAARLAHWTQLRILARCHGLMARALGWPQRTTVANILAAAEPYLRPALQGEAVLTLGAGVHDWREGAVDGVVSVGPLECMPSKLAEAQFHHAAEREGLISLSLSLIGDPLDPEALENFVYEVHRRFAARQAAVGRREPQALRRALTSGCPATPAARRPA